MATQAFWTWDAKGRPFTVCRPIRELVDLALANNVPLLGTIGNLAHLKTNFPEDHTPFSFTPWPWPLPGYVVTACDLGASEWCWGFLEDCKAGLHPWVKYINFMGKNYSVKRNWGSVNSGDIHFHCSARTDFLDSPVTRNPWNRVITPIPSLNVGRKRNMLFFFCANADGGDDTPGDHRWAVVTGDGRWVELETQAQADAVCAALGVRDGDKRSAQQVSPLVWVELREKFAA